MTNKTYKLARDLGVFKKGAEFEFTKDTIFIITKDNCSTLFQIKKKDIPAFLADGTIEVVKEKEFTEDDMIEFARYFANNHTYAELMSGYLEGILNQWKEARV